MPLTVFRVTAVFAVRSGGVGGGGGQGGGAQKTPPPPPPPPNALASQTFTTKGTTPSDKVA
jgi:hypothetical protein